MRLNALLLLFTLSAQAVPAQEAHISKVEPPNWWTGMKQTRVQLMLYGEGLEGAKASCASSGIHIAGTTSTGNPSYLFVDLELSPTIQAGTVSLQFTTAQGTTTLSYPL